MRVGVSLRTAYGPDIGGREAARWTVERARAARDAGLDSLFLGDHHNVPVPYLYLQNVPMLGRLLADWDDRRCGALFLLPLWHPVLLAEQIGTLAALASGPFVVQCALGAGPQFDGFGVALRTRPSRFETCLDIVRRLLAGEEVQSDGPWPVHGAKIGPIPDEPVEFWIGAAAAPGIDRAARLGDAFIAGPEATPPEAAALATTYRERCDVHGRRGRLVIRRDVHVGSTDDDARRVAGPVVDGGYRGFDPAALVVGGPETVAETFAALAAQGYEEVLVRHLANDQAEVLASFERLAAVRDAVDAA